MFMAYIVVTEFMIAFLKRPSEEAKTCHAEAAGEHACSIDGARRPRTAH